MGLNITTDPSQFANKDTYIMHDVFSHDSF